MSFPSFLFERDLSAPSLPGTSQIHLKQTWTSKMSFTSATFDHPELRDAEVLVTAGRSLDSCVHFTDEAEVKGSVFSNCGLSQFCSSGGGGDFPY